jgi:hypothetical protein
MQIIEIFDGIANKLLTDFDKIQAQIDHAGERGKQRERAIRDFLAKYLPRKYALGTGHVIDVEGSISKQCDIVIYDDLNCPLLLAEEGYQLFPAEAVFGVIEVKSALDANTIAQGVQNIQSVKQLKRIGHDEQVLGGIFAYRSKYGKGRIEAIANALRRENKSIPPRERLDLVCVLTDGLIFDYKGFEGWEEEGAMHVFLDATPSVLLLFLYYLIDLLEVRHSTMPSLIHYASGGELGIVRLLPSADYEE